jgi:hypothetical protein
MIMLPPDGLCLADDLALRFFDSAFVVALEKLDGDVSGQRCEGEEPDLFLLCGAEGCDPVFLGLAFGGLFLFGSLEQG